MAKKTIIINGRTFEVRISNDYNCYNGLYAGRSIWDCYDRPSNTKVDIYLDWKKWALNANVEDFGVASYNCHFFTLTGIYDAEDGNSYFIRITPAHNYAILIS